MKETLSLRVTRLRLAAGYRYQQELARAARMDPATLSKIVLGKLRTQPEMATIERLAIALGVTPSYLLYGDEAARPEGPRPPQKDPRRDVQAQSPPRPAEPDPLDSPAVRAAIQGAADAALISLAHAIFKAAGVAKTDALRKARRAGNLPAGRSAHP